MTKIANYDEFNYDYKRYWDNRDYENEAEKIILEKYLQDVKVGTFLDIGGSFGRNLDRYCSKSKIPIILDYSLETLIKNKKDILKKCPNVKLIAANAYHIPFKSNTIDASMMIRVLHHIEDQNSLLKEISRITKNKGLFILEYANKMHLKARLKWILTFKLKNFSSLPYQQPTQGNFEGTKGKNSVFLNYHSKHIKKLLTQENFKILKSMNCSFLRISILKKYIPFKMLINLEKFLQKTFSWKNIAPSIIIKSIKRKEEKDPVYNKFSEILCCPKCKNNLNFESEEASCKNCNKIFKQKSGIWDFRI